MIRSIRTLGALVVGVALASPAAAGQGNKLPPGPHFMLNVIAFDAGNCPAGDFTDSNRHMIAVQSDFRADDLGSTQAGTDKNSIVKTNTIKLTKGPEIQVLDGNACNKGGAELMLPIDPFRCDTNGDGVIDDRDVANDPACVGEDLQFQEYQVFLRLVGRLRTGIGVTTCADEAIDLDGDGVVEDTVICSTENVIRMRAASSKFEDVTRQLLTLCLDTDGSGACDTRVGIFDQALSDAFWQWNTLGKAHAQLVFVPLPD